MNLILKCPRSLKIFKKFQNFARLFLSLRLFHINDWFLKKLLTKHISEMYQIWCNGFSCRDITLLTKGQSGKLLQTTITVVLCIIRRSAYQGSQKCKIDYVVWRIKSVFSKLALLLRAWQWTFFTKLERRVKQRNSPFKKKKKKKITI